MKQILFVLLYSISIVTFANERCTTDTFAGVTTTRCKVDGKVVSVCKSKEFAGRITTTCQYF